LAAALGGAFGAGFAGSDALGTAFGLDFGAAFGLAFVGAFAASFFGAGLAEAFEWSDFAGAPRSFAMARSSAASAGPFFAWGALFTADLPPAFTADFLALEALKGFLGEGLAAGFLAEDLLAALGLEAICAPRCAFKLF